MRALPGLLLLCATSVATLAPAPAHADELPGPTRAPSVEEIDEARRLFHEGNAAAQAGELAEALARFTRAYALSANPAALFNAARTMRSLGRHAASRRAFDQLLSSTTLSEAAREEATRLRDDEAARACELVLDGVPPARAGLSVRVDGALHADDGSRPLTLELDAGEHGLLVELAGHLPFEWHAVLEEGARERLRVSLVASPAARSIIEEPLFWVVVGSVVALGGALAAYLGWDAAQLRPESMTVVRL